MRSDSFRAPPHLPFLKGAPSFRPGLEPISENLWLAPDTEAQAWLNDKRLLMKLMRKTVSAGELNDVASEEALAMIMGATGKTPLDKMPTALEEAATLVSDDLCLIEEAHDGDWIVTAGVVCAPTFWRIPEKIGLDLGAVHGEVPGGDPGLAKRISRVFRGLQPGQILERFNWTIQVDNDHHTPDRPSPAGKDYHSLHLRVERQTVRKLPRSRAILFTIRNCLDPLMPILARQDQREAFEDAWLGAPDQVRRYKCWHEIEHLVADACRIASRGL